MNNLHEKLINEVCEYFGVPFHDVFTRRRRLKLVNAKKVIYWILRRDGLTYNQIARIVKKDHETVMMGIRTLPDEYKPYALDICNKYKKWGLKDALEKENALKKEKRKKIVHLLNQGKDIYYISEVIKESITFIKEQLSMYIEQKTIPNYSTGKYIIKYFEKNKKNY